jgi:(heptosyl)LPS beta-1,4-glucosyltransferase
MSSSLSVVINALNEGKNLPGVIGSVKDVADEIVVVDMESEDNTSEVAKKLGAKVFTHKRLSYVEPARNFALRKVSGDWILVLDPDEEVSSSLGKKIKEIVQKNEADYYRIARKNIIFGKWITHAYWWPDYNIRLFKKGAVSWNEVIHKVPMTQGKGAEFPAKEELAIIHHHYDSIEKYLEHLNRYTSAQKNLKIREGYKFSWKDLIEKPVDEFLRRYFSGEGYKDGVHGLALSLLQAFSELILYLKIWQEEKFKEEEVPLSGVITEMRAKESELHFWQSDALFKATNNFVFRIRRRLRI